ncbi:hypothetical protein ACFFX0_23050 [Citricoccus parietis]|uniref:Uncharacterized protein n=1 Tax=Citricoccus parietis TaxID=592307 RepID=A0ABV5G4P9_9MICC
MPALRRDAVVRMGLSGGRPLRQPESRTGGRPRTDRPRPERRGGTPPGCRSGW